jgi:2-keto-4-pentenoate hydratase/2-oxohepta-3-ene-1,7-dioic acid hydratase in catechol pathway
MAHYKLANYLSPSGPSAGAVIGTVVYNVAELTHVPGYSTVEQVLDHWDEAHPTIEAAAECPSGDGQPLHLVTLLAPVSRPGAIYCIGSNYRDHSEEMRIAAGRPPQQEARALGNEPFFFIKSSHSIGDPGTTVKVTTYTEKPDWEIELVVVIGRKARDLSVDDALDCVAGYTIGNDLSARDLSRRPLAPAESLFRADWVRHKSFDNSAPIGPWITPAAHIKDPTDLRMRLWVNESLKQDSNSRNMIFTAAEQIAHLSSGITLHQGDLIMTGTPAGVGAGSNTFLCAGDTVTMEIAEIGQMKFHIA